MKHSLDNYNAFVIASANIKYLATNLIKDMKDFYTYTKNKKIKTIIKYYWKKSKFIEIYIIFKD